MTILAGLPVTVAGAVLTVRQVARRMRETIRERSARQVEEIADVASQAILFGGVATVLFGNIAQHIGDRRPPSVPWLSLISMTSIVLVFGVQLGRLLMRWQMRRVLAAPRNTEIALRD
ncbi:MAG TPA: hypothetical protein VGF56_05560 [Rhizomicrobium sp.]|jgi:protein-S-isoprenylcysteine O-methyltransferase Ste14